MDRSHHPVLAVISNCYSEAKGRFPRVTHPCATNPEGFVRLACVRHAASVRSEPGSNSQVCVTTPGPRIETRQAQASNFGSRYLHLSNVMDTKDMSDIGLFNRYPEPEDPRTGRRRPHVPSSKPTMSKNHQIHRRSDRTRRTTILPDFSTGGLGVRLSWRPGQPTLEARLSGGGHMRACSRFVKRFMN